MSKLGVWYSPQLDQLFIYGVDLMWWETAEFVSRLTEQTFMSPESHGLIYIGEL